MDDRENMIGELSEAEKGAGRKKVAETSDANTAVKSVDIVHMDGVRSDADDGGGIFSCDDISETDGILLSESATRGGGMDDQEKIKREEPERQPGAGRKKPRTSDSDTAIKPLLGGVRSDADDGGGIFSCDDISETDGILLSEPATRGGGMDDQEKIKREELERQPGAGRKKPRTSDSDTAIKPLLGGGATAAHGKIPHAAIGCNPWPHISSAKAAVSQGSVSVIMPGFPVDNLIGEGIVHILFKSISNHKLERFCSSFENQRAVSLPPDKQEAFVRIKGTSFAEYLQSNMNGLVARAHGLGEGTDAAAAVEGTTTYVMDGSNGGIIKAAASRLLDWGRPSERKCEGCQEPGDFIVSCCSLVICSRCIRDEVTSKHSKVPTSTCCQGQGALGMLEQSRDIITSKMDKGLFCTSQLILTVEAEQVLGRSQRFDIFVFRLMDSLDTIWIHRERGKNSARCPEQFTYAHHMDRAGNLRCIHRFKRKLTFLH